MTDVLLARAELKALIVQATAGRAYAQTAVAAATSAENAFTAVITRAENAQEALEDDGAGELPVLDIHDPLPVQAGNPAKFDVTMDRASDTLVAVSWDAVSGVWVYGAGALNIEPGVRDATIELETTPDLANSIRVTLHNPAGATIGRATATATILPPGNGGGDPDLSRGLLFELPPGDVTAPAQQEPLDDDVVTVSLVMDLDVANTHQKALCFEDALSVGLHPSGPMDLWCYAGEPPTFQPVKTPPVYQYRKASWVLIEFGDDAMRVMLDGKLVDTETVAGPRVSTAGRRWSLMDGFWKGVSGKDPAQGRLCHCRLWDRPLSTAEQLLEQEAVADLVETEPTPPDNGDIDPPPVEPPPIEPPPVDPGSLPGLEPVDNSFVQVDLEAAKLKTPRIWRGPGFGLNASDPAIHMLPRVRSFAHMLDRAAIGTNVIRILAPENAERAVLVFKPYVDLFRPQWIVGTGFVWRGKITVEKFIDGVAECRRRGLMINVVVMENEPDGNSANKIAGGESKYVGYVDDAYTRLKHHGLETEVEIHGVGEWRHWPHGGLGEARVLAKANLLGPKNKVQGLSRHIYDKDGNEELMAILDEAGIGAGSWETGNNGTPSCIARMICGANTSSIFDMIHYVAVATGTPNSEQLGQALVDYHGKPRPWYGAWKITNRPEALAPQSSMRRVFSSHRPPNIPSSMARLMLRDASRSGGWNPWHNAFCAERPDKRLVFGIVNTTHGENAPNPYTSGHAAGAKQQFTMFAKERETAPDRGWTAYRASSEGAITGPQRYRMNKGRLRCKVGPAETIVLVEDAA